jgi:hypothetical protein
MTPRIAGGYGAAPVSRISLIRAADIPDGCTFCNASTAGDETLLRIDCSRSEARRKPSAATNMTIRRFVSGPAGKQLKQTFEAEIK